MGLDENVASMKEFVQEFEEFVSTKRFVKKFENSSPMAMLVQESEIVFPMDEVLHESEIVFPMDEVLQESQEVFPNDTQEGQEVFIQKTKYPVLSHQENIERILSFRKESIELVSKSYKGLDDRLTDEEREAIDSFFDSPIFSECISEILLIKLFKICPNARFQYLKKK